ncbi:cell division topological specificity factor MinE, partial [Burkholderia pseudomallei]
VKISNHDIRESLERHDHLEVHQVKIEIAQA